MEVNSDEIYCKLIEDKRFIEWVRSDAKLNQSYWDDWKIKNPGSEDILQEAVQTVKILEFNDKDIKPGIVSQQWEEVRRRVGEEPGKPVSKIIFSKVQRIAAILFLPILLFSAYLIYQNSNLKNEKQIIAEAQVGVINTIEALPGTKVIVDLPDSSKVWLNSGSVLKYPVRFSKSKREVEIIGEGYFEVAKSQVPFFVKSSGPAVKVYGTEFNMDTYDKDHISLALVEGKVSVLHKNRELFVEPGQLVEYNGLSNNVSIEDADLEEHTSWRDGYYIFRGRSLESILRKLKYRYDCEFIIDDQELAKYKYNAKIRDLGLDQFLHFLSLTGPIDYSIEKIKSEFEGDAIEVRIKRKTKYK